jgi:hypothetical protein
MQTAVQIELACGFHFGVEGEVSTAADLRRLLKKADAKLRAAFKAVPEIADESVRKVRIGAAQKQPEAVTA